MKHDSKRLAASLRMVKRLGLVAAAAVAVVAAGPLAPASAASSALGLYRVTDLGTLPGASWSAASAINERGDVVGESGDRAVLWRDGRITDLGTLGGPYGSAVDVNEQGDVVGYSTTIDFQFHAFLWRNGRMTDLTLPGDDTSYAAAINDRGDVVGRSGGRAVLWRHDGSVVDLTARTGLFAVEGLDNEGGLVGEVLLPDGMNTVPALWSHGQTTLLSSTPGSASAINDRGEVTGFFVVGTAGSFVWRHGDLTQISEGMEMQAQAINNRGQVVGGDFVWESGTLSELPRSNGNPTWAADINNHGDIVGSNGHAVLLSR